ncbi:MAG: hypothetical protein MJY89_07710 [Bacteroidales bacterium]|nr:hypothetical protein [Bacteroidales bacterium]
MKYRKQLPKEIKRIAEYHLRFYQSNKKELARYQREIIPSATPAYAAAAGGHESESRPAERVALKLATDRYIFQLEQSIAIVEDVVSRLNQADAFLVRHVYWTRDLTVTGAANKMHMDRSTAYEHLNDILYDVATMLGYVRDPD